MNSKSVLYRLRAALYDARARHKRAKYLITAARHKGRADALAYAVRMVESLIK